MARCRAEIFCYWRETEGKAVAGQSGNKRQKQKRGQGDVVICSVLVLVLEERRRSPARRLLSPLAPICPFPRPTTRPTAKRPFRCLTHLDRVGPVFLAAGRAQKHLGARAGGRPRPRRAVDAKRAVARRVGQEDAQPAVRLGHVLRRRPIAQMHLLGRAADDRLADARVRKGQKAGGVEGPGVWLRRVGSDKLRHPIDGRGIERQRDRGAVGRGSHRVGRAREEGHCGRQRHQHQRDDGSLHLVGREKGRRERTAGRRICKRGMRKKRIRRQRGIPKRRERFPVGRGLPQVVGKCFRMNLGCLWCNVGWAWGADKTCGRKAR